MRNRYHALSTSLFACSIALAACDPPRPPQTAPVPATERPANPPSTASTPTPPAHDGPPAVRIPTLANVVDASAPSADAATAPARPALAPITAPTDAQMRAFIEGTNTFALDMYTQLRATTGNMVFSPASISVALAMTWAGARNTTATELAHAMHLGADADGTHRAAGALIRAWNADAQGFELRTANRLFGAADQRFEAPFLALTRETYGAPLEPLDFVHATEASRVHINDWVAQQTRNRITDLLPSGSLDGDTRLVLTNAMYLHAQWGVEFERRATYNAAFHVNAAETPYVATMHAAHDYPYVHRDGVRALSIPYTDSRYAMTFILPDDPAGLDGFLRTLTPARLRTLTDALQYTRVDVSIPRFRVEPGAPVRLRSALSALGVHQAFDRTAADFTGMAPIPRPEDRLYISEGFHKAFVAVDEAGTEAAAATAIVMARMGAAAMPAPPSESFNADHPFLFALRDTQTGALLFLGHVRDPR